MFTLFSRMSIRLKLITLFSIVFMLISAFNFTYYPKLHKQQALVNLKNHVRNMAEMIALASGIGLDLLDLSIIGKTITWAKKDSRLAYLGIFDPDGEEFAVYNPDELTLDLKAMLKRNDIFETNNKIYIALPIIHNETNHGKLLLGLSLKDMYASITANRKNTLYISSGILVLGILVSVIFSNMLTKPLIQLGEAAQEVSKGKTNVDINIDSQDEVGHLGKCFMEMLENIKKSIEHQITAIASTAKTLFRSSSEIDSAAQNQASIATQQATSITEITVTMEELTTSASQVADNSNSVVEIAADALKESEAGMQAIEALKGKMDEITADNQDSIQEIVALGKKSKEIGKIMGIINTITDQTKLIAFNAALEASSAGEAGKRFGVVAVEIRRLADNVMDSTSEIEQKVDEIQQAIDRLVVDSERGTRRILEGTRLAGETLTELEKLVSGAKSTNDAAAQISLSTQQQKTAAGQIFSALKEIEQGIHQSTSAAKQTTSITTELTNMAQELNHLVGKLQLKENNRGDQPA